METLEDIRGDEIRTFRQDLDLTQAELAERLGGSTRAIEDWEAGRRQAPAMLRLALAAIRTHARPWSPIFVDPRYPNREDVNDLVRDRLFESAADRAQTQYEAWATTHESLPFGEAALLGFLETINDGYEPIRTISNWEWLPQSGWQTSMVIKPNLGNGLHPNVAFESRHDKHFRRLAVFLDSKRPNERLPGRLRIEQALVDQNFRVMTFNGEEFLADPEGCADRISDILSDMVEECLVAAGRIPSPPRRRDDSL
ncbi:MAG: helix-turn-helix domain-containing protein [Brevundimonas sp.]